MNHGAAKALLSPNDDMPPLCRVERYSYCHRKRACSTRLEPQTAIDAVLPRAILPSASERHRVCHRQSACSLESSVRETVGATDGDVADLPGGAKTEMSPKNSMPLLALILAAIPVFSSRTHVPPCTPGSESSSGTEIRGVFWCTFSHLEMYYITRVGWGWR